MFGQYPGYAFAPYPFPQQQRLNVLEQQYPQFAQYPQGGGNSTQMPMLKGRAVTSFDEAKAAMIDLDGSVFIFPDIANNAIYTKQINLDGTASINTYRREDNENGKPIHESGKPAVSAPADFSSKLAEDVEYIKAALMYLQDDFSKFKNGVMSNERYAEPNANDGTDVTANDK